MYFLLYLCLVLPLGEFAGGALAMFEQGLVLEICCGDFAIFHSADTTHFNLHYEGRGASFVLHTEKGFDKWKEGCNGWAANHYFRWIAWDVWATVGINCFYILDSVKFRPFLPITELSEANVGEVLLFSSNISSPVILDETIGHTILHPSTPPYFHFFTAEFDPYSNQFPQAQVSLQVCLLNFSFILRMSY